MLEPMRIALLVLMACAGAQFVRAQPPPRADFVFEHVTLIPMTDDIAKPDMTVAVRDGRIVAILGPGEHSRQVSGQRIDGRGKFLMPGLSDMHVHLRIPPQDFFDLNLAAGVTTVFNMGIADGGGLIDHLALRARIAAGSMDGPRYLVSGPQIESRDVASPGDVERLLNEHADRHYDALKIHGDLPPAAYDALIAGARARGFRIRGHGQHMMPLAQTLRMDTVEHVEELLYMSPDATFGREAKSGAGDNGNIDDFLSAYRHNLARLEDPAYRAAVIGEIAASGKYWDPTIAIYAMIPVYVADDSFAALAHDARLAYLPESARRETLDPARNEYRAGLVPVFSRFLRSVGDPSSVAGHFARNVKLLQTLSRELHAAGVPLLVGSDAFGGLVPGFAQHQEMELMVDAGLSPYEVLRAATVNAARYLGEASDGGTIEIGKKADFILLGANPLVRIQNAADVQGVFTQGRWHSAVDLRSRLSRVASHSGDDQPTTTPAK